MTCKDCIHERVCEALCPKGLLPYQSSDYPAELFCLEFENKAGFVEVVRCKDCKYGEIDDPMFPNQRFCRHNGCDWNDENHFCSYGERE